MARTIDLRSAHAAIGDLPVNRSWMKAGFDRFGALAGLLLLSPLLLAVALLIKLDSPGPVLFVQHRHGKGGSVFPIFKFRTMAASASQGPFVQATANDMRITRIGKFLRQTSIDELPQLINVLRGEMSLIGPRPHPLALDETFRNSVANYMSRYSTRPGLTGLAQVYGHRGETPSVEAMDMRVACDLDYIRNWSLWLDVQILIRSAGVVFRGI